MLNLQERGRAPCRAQGRRQGNEFGLAMSGLKGVVIITGSIPELLRSYGLLEYVV